MGRVLLAIDDVELAVQLVGLLDEANHLVEHIFDLTEGLLRAEITRPDALVVDLARPRLDHGLLRRWAQQYDVPIVLLSRSSNVERIARQMGASFFQIPSEAETASRDDEESDDVDWGPSFVDVVETAARIASRERAQSPSIDRKRSGSIKAAPAVLLAAAGPNARAVIASFVTNHLGLRCEAVEGAAEAVLRLSDDFEGPRIQALLLDPQLLIDSVGGLDLAATIRTTGVPVVLLRLSKDDEATSVGRAAWDVVPALRAAVAKARAQSA